MTIKFNLNYTTAFGEELLLNIVADDADNIYKTEVYNMRTFDGHTWECRIDGIDTGARTHIDYFFTVANAGKTIRREWTGMTHRIDLNATRATAISVHGRWNDIDRKSVV